MAFDKFPAVDDNYNFPPEVREAIAGYAELIAAFSAKSLETTVAGHTTSLALKAPLASPAFTGTPTGITKTHVGLANVDNTSDANKPVSTAQAAADNLLAKGQIDEVHTAGTTSGIAATTVVADLVAASLVAGRKYRLIYKFTSASGSANEAMGINLVKSVTADTTTAGTSVEDSATLWTAPIAASGSYHQMTWCWEATATETVNLKVTLVRAVGSSGIDISGRRLFLFDDGMQP